MKKDIRDTHPDMKMKTALGGELCEVCPSVPSAVGWEDLSRNLITIRNDVCHPFNLQMLFELTKFRLVSLVLWSVSVGFYLASRGPLDLLLLAKTLLGTALIGSGAMALNQYQERESDSKMKRTMNRPLPGKRIQAGAVLLLGILISMAGFLILFTGVNQLAGIISVLTLLSYLGIYTPLKTRTSLCTLAGAVPGAIPPLLGGTAVRGEMTLESWVLFLILFLWQLPHVLAIGWVSREDFANAGFKMLAVVDPTGKKVGQRIFIYSLALIPLSILPALLGMTGMIYFCGALLLGVWFAVSGWQVRQELDSRAKSFFRHSIIYLAVLFLLMVLDKR
jgi:protoheme IX farnesyltransferase